MSYSVTCLRENFFSISCVCYGASMKQYDPDIHQRRSIRLHDYNYAATGAYFVTICVHKRESLFGVMASGGVVLNEAGRMVAEVWQALPERFPRVILDECVIMPDHFHGVLFLQEGRGDSCDRPMGQGDRNIEGDHKDRPCGTAPNSLGRIIQVFKSITTHAYIRGVDQNHWPPFPGRLWQRNYYERIIRDDGELRQLREYVAGNPARWGQDDSDDVVVGALLAAPGAE